MSESCSMEVQSTGGLKNALFGGEGIFNTVITGPGRVYVQSMPALSLAHRIAPFLPTVSTNDGGNGGFKINFNG